MPNNNVVRRLKEQLAVIECTDKPIKRTMIEYTQYVFHVMGIEVPDVSTLEDILYGYKGELKYYEEDYLTPFQQSKLFEDANTGSR